MRVLQVLLKLRDIPFDASDNRIMCFPHIINICVQHVVVRFTDLELADLEFDEQSVPPAESEKSRTFNDAVSRDPIALCRSIICAIRASGKRHDDFEHVIHNGNEQGWFEVDGKKIKVEPHELLRDVKTRWDSMYQMIRCAREMRPVGCNCNLALFH
jgi:hypothetical protein